MSRVGKQHLVIPDKTIVTVNGGTVTVAGPLGTLTREFKPEIAVSVEGSEVIFTPKHETEEIYPLWGTYASHVKNMIAGVNKAYEKKLILEGVGFRAEMKGADLVMQLGFSHPVTMPVPQGLTVTAEKGVLTFTGINKELVGEFSARIRALKKPEPYKGKGFHYADEVIRRKEGKRAA